MKQKLDEKGAKELFTVKHVQVCEVNVYFYPIYVALPHTLIEGEYCQRHLTKKTMRTREWSLKPRIILKVK